MWTCTNCGTENPRSEFFCKGRNCGIITITPVYEETTYEARIELLKEYFVRVCAEDPHHRQTEFDAAVIQALERLRQDWVDK